MVFRSILRTSPSATRLLTTSTRSSNSPDIIRIQGATFYRNQPSHSSDKDQSRNNPPLFPGLDFSYPSHNRLGQYLAIIGPSNHGKTTLFELLRGHHLCFPPTARSFPYLSTSELIDKDYRLTNPLRAIQYVGFNLRERGLTGIGSYMSARYESRRDESDFTLSDFLKGSTQLNVIPQHDPSWDHAHFDKVLNDLNLVDLANMPLANLSNGQSRRARIAKALLGKPELLLLDEPFMGLDPPSAAYLSPLLYDMARSASPRLLISLRPQDPIPDWITHLLYLGKECQITHQGPKDAVRDRLQNDMRSIADESDGLTKLDHIPYYLPEFGRILTSNGVVRRAMTVSDKQHQTDLAHFVAGKHFKMLFMRLGYGEKEPVYSFSYRNKPALDPRPPVGEPIIEMDGVKVSYGNKTVLGDWHQQLELKYKGPPTGARASTPLADPRQTVLLESDQDGATKAPGLKWNVHRGQRWAVVGPNGSGKTTLLSLITSDHPQAYAAPMRLFGRSRLPSPGRPGLSLFDIQSRIGHSSPEVHAFFPRNLTVRQTLESAYAEAPLSPPKLDVQSDSRVDACLRWFQGELNPAVGMNPTLKREILRREREPALEQFVSGEKEQFYHEYIKYWHNVEEEDKQGIEWADERHFGELTFAAQRLALFLRAIIAKPDIVLLDEAFSGMDDMMRNKCHLFLEHGEARRFSIYRYTGKGLENQREDIGESDRGMRDLDRSFTIREGLTAEQALIVVSHVREEIPRCVRNYLYLPEAGSGVPAVFGTVRKTTMRVDGGLWNAIWKIPSLPRRKINEKDRKEMQDEEEEGNRPVAARSGRPRKEAEEVEKMGEEGVGSEEEKEQKRALRERRRKNREVARRYKSKLKESRARVLLRGHSLRAGNAYELKIPDATAGERDESGVPKSLHPRSRLKDQEMKPSTKARGRPRTKPVAPPVTMERPEPRRRRKPRRNILSSRRVYERNQGKI